MYSQKSSKQMCTELTMSLKPSCPYFANEEKRAPKKL